SKKKKSQGKIARGGPRARKWLNARRPSSTSHAAARAGPPGPAFQAFFAGAGRPLLPSMIDYSVFSQLAAARGSIISGPVSRLAPAFNFRIQGQIRLRII